MRDLPEEQKPPSSGSRIKPGKKAAPISTGFQAGILIGLPFDPEEGCDMFLRNIG
jgi:hypothetical protein